MAQVRKLSLFLAGDVMTGRGIDQVLPHSVDPLLLEPAVSDAREYVELAELASGSIPRRVPFDYVWGDALHELEQRAPELRIVNLETSITERGSHFPGKGIHYRMHPSNVGCLTAAKLDCCTLANNHVLDFGRTGLLDTLATLAEARIRSPGAGHDLEAAFAPAIFPAANGGRVLVFCFGTASSGIPPSFAAREHEPGVALLPDLSQQTLASLADRIERVRRANDVVIASVHWGENFGYAIPKQHLTFARALVRQGVDLVHGHSSHHALPFEVFEGKLILYGCGDFINDYEGIRGHEAYRSDLVLMYLPSLTASGELASLTLVPFRLSKFRLQRATSEESRWLCAKLRSEARDFRCDVEISGAALELSP